jgi:hypothetical protein
MRRLILMDVVLNRRTRINWQVEESACGTSGADARD